MSESRSTPRVLSAALIALLLLAPPVSAVFEMDLKLSSSWSRHGEADGEFWSANCLDIAPDGTLWIGELRQPRIQHFDLDGNWLGTVVLPGSGVIDLDMAPDGWIYVVTASDVWGHPDVVVPVDPAGFPQAPLSLDTAFGRPATLAATQTELLVAYGLAAFGRRPMAYRFTRDGTLLEAREIPGFLVAWSIAANDAGAVYTGGYIGPSLVDRWMAGVARVDIPSRARPVQALPDNRFVATIGVDRTELVYTFGTTVQSSDGDYGSTIHISTPEGGLAAKLTRPTAGGGAEVLHDFAVDQGRIVMLTSALPIPRVFAPGTDQQRVEIFRPAVRTLLTAMPDTALSFTVDGRSYTGSAGFDWPAGTRHTLTVPPRPISEPGHRRDLIGWSDSRTGTTRSYTAGSSPDALWPVYQDMYRVDIVVDGPGTVTPNNDWYPAGTTLSLVATPDPCSGFLGWAQAGTTDLTRTIVVQGAVTDTARFGGPPLVYPSGIALSASATDPGVHQDTPAGGVRSVYLWLSDPNERVCALEAQITGDLNVLGFVPEPNVFNIAALPDLLMAIPTAPAGAPFLLGRFLVDDHGGSLCLDPSQANGKLVVVDCQTFTEWPASVFGFSSATAPCVREMSCGPVGGGPDRLVRAAPSQAQRLLLAAFPNPFRDATEIRLSPHAGPNAQLRIYDVRGRLVRTLQGGRAASGSVVSWDGRNAGGRSVGSGIYFVRLVDGDRTETERVVRAR